MKKNTKPVRKGKKKETVIPYMINTAGRRNNAVTALYVAIRIALLFMASYGVCLLLVQIYKVPINHNVVAMACLFAVLGFNALFILLKYRFALPLIAIVAYFNLNYAMLADGARNFLDIVFIMIDGRLLYTERFASIPADFLFNPTTLFVTETTYFIMVLCVAVSLLFTLAARSRFVGAVLIAVVIIYIPAFGGEIATVVPALKWVVIAMLGLFAVWAGGNYSNGFSNTGPKRRLKRKFSIAGGVASLPGHAFQGALAAVIALTLYSGAERLLPENEALDLMNFLSSVSEKIQTQFSGLGEFITDKFWEITNGFNDSFKGLDDNGYFHENTISSTSNGTDRLSVTSPTTSDNPVLRVTFEDISEPIYLRNGIGVVYNGDRRTWDVPNSDSAVKELNKLLETYYPEHWMYIYRRRSGYETGSATYNPDNYIGLQRVTTEYLAKTRNVMMPMVPYLSLYKGNDEYNRNLDTVLQSKKPFSKNTTLTWDILYPRLNEGAVFSRVSVMQKWTDVMNRTVIDADYDAWIDADYIDNKHDYMRVSDGFYYSYINADTQVLGMTSAEYLEKTAEYERLINEIYTRTDESERANMQQLAENVLSNLNLSGIDTDFNMNNLVSDKVFAAQTITHYLKNNYSYSLTADNNSGDNTMLGNFLFETKSGHCALYASAMTLLMRELGHPARYVTGYVVHPERSQLSGNGLYECTLLENNLHAWVEVYYEGLGWIPYDPTPTISRDIFESTTTSVTTRVTPETTSQTTTESRDRPTNTTSGDVTNTSTGIDKNDTEGGDSGRNVIPAAAYVVIGTIFVIALITAAILLFFKSLAKREAKMLAGYKNVDSRSTAAEMYGFILRLLATQRIKRQDGELPSEFAQRVTELLSDEVDVDFTLVMEVLEKLEFSREELSEEDYICLSMFTRSLYREYVLGRNGLIRQLLRILLVR